MDELTTGETERGDRLERVERFKAGELRKMRQELEYHNRLTFMQVVLQVGVVLLLLGTVLWAVSKVP